MLHDKDALIYQYQKTQIFIDKQMETNTHQQEQKWKDSGLKNSSITINNSRRIAT